MRSSAAGSGGTLVTSVCVPALVVSVCVPARGGQAKAHAGGGAQGARGGAGAGGSVVAGAGRIPRGEGKDEEGGEEDVSRRPVIICFNG